MAEEVDQIGQTGADHAETPTWLVWAQGITAVLTFVGTFWLAYEGKASAPFAIAGVALLLIFRFGDLSSLSFEAPGGIKGALSAVRRETRKASNVTKEAEDAIESLRQLGMNLSKAVLTLHAVQGRQDAKITFRGKLRARDAIVQNLQDLGLAPDQAQQAAEVFDDYVINDLVARALHFAPEESGKEELTREIEATSLPMPKVSEFRAMFQEKGCLTDVTENFLTQAEKYQDTRQIDLSKIY